MPRPIFYVSLIVLAVISRLLPHPPNAVCMAAVGLFVGAYVRSWHAYAMPVVAMLVSDVIGHVLGLPGMGFYSLITMSFVYAGVVAAVPIGRWIGQGRENRSAVASATKWTGGSLAASSVFFLISNFGVWASGWYAMTGGGLIACYVAAVPFFGYTVAGDLIYTVILAGSYSAVAAMNSDRVDSPSSIPAPR